jgi:hypothetical protein
MKKTELKISLENILNRNGIELSSTLAQELLGLATIKAGGVKREFLPIKLSSYDDIKLLSDYSKHGAETFEDIESFLSQNDIQFEVLPDAIDVDTFYSLENKFIASYCIWFKEYRPLGQFSINKRSQNNVHYESKEAEMHWVEYGKRIKALDDDIIQIKNAVIDEVYTPAEGKVKITEIDALKVSLEENRKNKISIDDLLVPNSLQHTKGWKSKELMEDYFTTLGVVISSEEPQDDAQDDIVQDDTPKKTRKKK